MLDVVKIGKLGRSFGVKGWLKVYSFTVPSERILDYRPWHLGHKDGWKLTEVAFSKRHNNQLVVKLVGIDTPEHASLYTNLLIGAQAEALPSFKGDDYYWHELVGLTVITTQGVLLGKIDHLLATGANDVMVIQGERDYLLPYIPNDIIVSIDLMLGKMIVNWDPNF